jgi:hypothetical protein
LDAPGEDAESIRLSVDELWAFRADHARAITPLPRPDEPVDLGGIELKGEMCRVQLLRWDPSDQGFTLHAKVDPPAMWPDIRVLADGSSVSMSTQPPDEGDLRAMLPLSYSAIFSGSTIEIAIRMAARTVEPMVFVLPLTPADRRTAG